MTTCVSVWSAVQERHDEGEMDQTGDGGLLPAVRRHDDLLHLAIQDAQVGDGCVKKRQLQNYKTQTKRLHLN